MDNSGKRSPKKTSEASGVESFDERFKREMAAINGDLARLAESVESRPKIVPPTPKPTPAQPPTKVKASKPPAQPAPPAPPAPVATEVWPTGTDLADPKNFGVHAPTADLEQGTATADDYRQRLSRHIAFAAKVLHTSRVPAVVWREWRAFEKAAQERLRELANVSAAR